MTVPVVFFSPRGFFQSPRLGGWCSQPRCTWAPCGEAAPGSQWEGCGCFRERECTQERRLAWESLGACELTPSWGIPTAFGEEGERGCRWGSSPSMQGVEQCEPSLAPGGCGWPVHLGGKGVELGGVGGRDGSMGSASWDGETPDSTGAPSFMAAPPCFVIKRGNADSWLKLCCSKG